MERLTIRTNEASISFECESVGDIVRRLAAYEDTGLEPEEIEKAMDIVKSAVSAFEDFGVDRLAELAKADREGRCVVLPAPLGSQVWQFKYPTRIDENGEEWTICSVRKATVEPAPFGLTLSMVNQIGKIYWLSEEDALAALRREQDG